MMPVSADQVRACFVNASPADVELMTIPNLSGQPWSDLDFLGWADAARPQRGYLVLSYEDGPVGLLVHIPAGGPGHPRRSMCNLCHCVQPGGGVRLMSIPRAGELGLRHNMIGSYLCADLGCSLYLRGLRPLSSLHQLHETPDLAVRVERMRGRLNDLVHRVLTPPSAPAL